MYERELDNPRNNVLQGSVDERLTLEDSGNSEGSGRRNLGVRVLDRVQEVVCGKYISVDSIACIDVSLRVPSLETWRLVWNSWG